MKKPANCTELAGFILFGGIGGFEFPNGAMPKSAICSPICSPVLLLFPCFGFEFLLHLGVCASVGTKAHRQHHGLIATACGNITPSIEGNNTISTDLGALLSLLLGLGNTTFDNRRDACAMACWMLSFTKR